MRAQMFFRMCLLGSVVTVFVVASGQARPAKTIDARVIVARRLVLGPDGRDVLRVEARDGRGPGAVVLGDRPGEGTILTSKGGLDTGGFLRSGELVGGNVLVAPGTGLVSFRIGSALPGAGLTLYAWAQDYPTLTGAFDLGAGVAGRSGFTVGDLAEARPPEGAERGTIVVEVGGDGEPSISISKDGGRARWSAPSK